MDHLTPSMPARRARTAVAVLGLLGAFALGGCVVLPRAATDVTSTTATLTAVARCDGGRPVPCEYRMRWRAVGTEGWKRGPLHGPVRARTGRVTLHEKITGLMPGTRYRWQMGVRGDRLKAVAWFPGRSFTTAPASGSAARTPVDRTAPRTTLSAMPANVTQSASASFSFTANEAATFSCRLDLGVAVPCRSPKTVTGLRLGRHQFRVWARDAAGNVEPLPRVWSWAVFPPPSSRPLKVAAVGDIHPPSRSANSAATGVEAAKSDVILSIGDHQYQSGTPAEFRAGWDTDRWALNLPKMYPVLAPTHDDDWRDSYPLRYFNGAGPRHLRVPVTLRPHQSYSFTRGGWHFMAIDDACYRDTAHCSTAALEAWVRADLAAHRGGCTIAYWHEPYWTSPTRTHGRELAMRTITQALYAAGVELVLNGHQHGYERFAPQRPDGVRDDARGIRSFIVGTGGIGFYPWTGTARNSVTKQTGTYGVLNLTLRAGSYGWRFQPTSGGTYTDAGAGTCH
jgi:acid phosphatase type 7